MTSKQLTALLKAHNGWWEGDIARFPSVWDKDQFEKAYALAVAK